MHLFGFIRNLTTPQLPQFFFDNIAFYLQKNGRLASFTMSHGLCWGLQMPPGSAPSPSMCGRLWLQTRSVFPPDNLTAPLGAPYPQMRGILFLKIVAEVSLARTTCKSSSSYFFLLKTNQMFVVEFRFYARSVHPTSHFVNILCKIRVSFFPLLENSEPSQSRMYQEGIFTHRVRISSVFLF